MGRFVFYFGIAGMVLVLIFGIIVTIKFSASRKRIFCKLNQKYGIDIK